MTTTTTAKPTKMDTQLMQTVLGLMERDFIRQQSIRDPMTRHIVFLEKLCLLTDMAMAAFENAAQSLPEENADLKRRLESVLANTNDRIMGLIDWIQQPSYGPDHPVGQQEMEDARVDFIRSSTLPKSS